MASAFMPAVDLSAAVSAIELGLQALDAAFSAHDPGAIEASSQALHKALADAVVVLRHASRDGKSPMTPELRQRLLLAQARVMGQQQTVHRAAGSIERTLSVLLPQTESPSAYGGLSGRSGAFGIKGYQP